MLDIDTDMGWESKHVTSFDGNENQPTEGRIQRHLESQSE